MGRKYSVSFTDVAVTAAQDLFQIEAPSKLTRLVAMYLSQTSDVGDGSSENLLIKIQRVTDTVTNSATERALEISDSAATANLNVNQTTQLTTGAAILHAEAWNILQSFIYLPPPELRPVVEIGNAIVVTLPAPADSLTMSGTLYFEEEG